MIVLSIGHGVHGFTLDPSIGEFILTHKNINVPKSGLIYSINEGNRQLWDKPTLQFIQKQQEKNFRSRYIGSLVLDAHRTLLYGGIFSYPSDKKNINGKLRLLYECNPLAFIMEQANGAASTGTQRILDVVPTSLHQRTPIWIGSIDLVKEIEELYSKNS